MGGETSKFIRLEAGFDGCAGIADYQSNGDCAAGTGSFMDQQASRLLYDIEDVGDIVAGAGKAASIAGRCSVFAKSDMIHAQQKGYEPPEVLRGLCDAVIRNFRATIAKGKVIERRWRSSAASPPTRARCRLCAKPSISRTAACSCRSTTSPWAPSAPPSSRRTQPRARQP